MDVRPAVPEDAPAIARIYNDAIATTTATFDTKEKSVEDRQAWLAAHGEARPVLVAVGSGDETAEGGRGEVMGWAAASDWSQRPAYSLTAEVAVYVDRAHRGRGVGSRLLAALTERCRAVGVHVLIAQVVEGNEASRKLHEKHGFARVGVLREVGLKFGRRLDVLVMQKTL